MTNISMQSSHNGYLPTISPYGMPLSSPQLHAAHAGMPPSSMHNQNLNLDTSFQFAYHPNSFNAIPIHTHPHNTSAGENLTNQPLLAGYAPTMQTIPTQPPSAHPAAAQWSIAAHTAIPINPLGQPQSHLHTQTIQPHHSMQSNSPTATNLISSTHNPSTLTPQQQQQPTSLQQTQSHKSASLPAVQQSIVQSTSNSSGNLVQQTTSTNISPSNTPSSTTTNNQSQQTSNSNLAQLNTSSNQQIQQQPQPVPIHHNVPPQNWYSNPHLYSSTPIPHPTNLIANPNAGIAQANQPGAQVVVPFSHSQAVTFGYQAGYPATGYVPANLMQVSTPWQQSMNPYVYGKYINFQIFFRSFFN